MQIDMNREMVTPALMDGRADVVALYRAKIAHEPSAWTNSAETLHAE
jgi:hypothetical protein